MIVLFISKASGVRTSGIEKPASGTSRAE